MNEELKKYVNAYMDGVEVEFRWDASRWYNVVSLSIFETGARHFRIKPKAEDKWQRVIDEGYLCKFWDDGGDAFSVGKLHKDSLGSNKFREDDVCKYWYDNCEVLRAKGIKQPYFQGDDIPEIDGKVVVYFKDGDIDIREVTPDGFHSVDWSEVVAYIEV